MNFIKKIIRKIFITKRTRKNNRYLNYIQFFRRAAGQLAGFYVPVFLYQLTNDNFAFLNSHYTGLQKPMILIASFYLLERVVMALVSIAGAKIIEHKLGHKSSLVWGSFSYLGHMATLFFASRHPWLIYVAAIFSGLSGVFFWQSYNTLVSKNSSARHMGKDLSIITLWKNLVSMIMPAVGGVIAFFFGFDYLFLLAVIFILVSVVFVSSLEVKEEKDEVNLQEYLDWLKEKRFDQLFLSQAGRAFHDMSILLWPLYVFLLLGDVKQIGFIYSIALLLSTVINLFAGNVLDRDQKTKLPYVFSGGLLSLLWIARAWITSAWSVIMVDSANRVVGGFHWLYYDRTLYHRGKGSQAFSYFTYRATNRSIALVIYWLILLCFFLLVPIGWKGLFVLGMIGALLTIFIQDKISLEDEE